MFISLKGWQIVAGGRSEAQTTGTRPNDFSTPQGCQMIIVKEASRFEAKGSNIGNDLSDRNSGTPSGCRLLAILSGGLRCASTTGYFLSNPSG